MGQCWPGSEGARGVHFEKGVLKDESLSSEKYEVIASEPLHIMNLITELPHIGDTATRCTHLIDCCLAKEKNLVQICVE